MKLKPGAWLWAFKQHLFAWRAAVYQKRHPLQWETGEKIRVLVADVPGFNPPDYQSSLEMVFPGWQDVLDLQFAGDRLALYHLAPQAEVFVGSWLPDETARRAAALKWAHFTISGLEFLEEISLAPGVRITSAVGISAPGIAEHVLGLMLALDRRLDLAAQRQERWQWQQTGILQNIRGLNGRVAGVIGLGNNGQAVAALCHKVGLRVIGLDIRSNLALDGIEKIVPPDKLHELLSEADFAIVCLPLTAQTRRLIGPKELEALGPHGFLVNVARGGLVDEQALALALRRGSIAGAALDVLSNEPPPFFHPLRGCPNLIITPHVAGNIYTFRKEIILDTCRRLRTYTQETRQS